MILFAPILAMLGVGFLCWLTFKLAVHALPFFVALTAGLVAYGSGAGLPGAFVLGVLAAAATHTLGQIAFARAPTPAVRVSIGLIYAGPAAVAGFYVSLGLVPIATPSEPWRVAFALCGALLVAATAWKGIATQTPSGTTGRVGGLPADRPSLQSAAGEG